MRKILTSYYCTTPWHCQDINTRLSSGILGRSNRKKKRKDKADSCQVFWKWFSRTH